MVEKITIHSAWGENATLDSIDARRTVKQHPDQWRMQPFPAGDIEQGKADKVKREAHERAVLASQRAAEVAPVQIDPKVIEAAVKAGVAEELRRREQEAADPRLKQVAEEEAAWRVDLTKPGTTAAQLHKIAEAENIPVESDDNKATLIEKIIAGRKTAAASEG